jgi:hypothetical protein
LRRDSHSAADACALPTDARANRVLLVRERLRMMRLLMLVVLMRMMWLLLLVVLMVVPVPLDRNGDEAIRGGQVQTEQRRVIEFGREKDVRGRRSARAHDGGGGGG